MHFEESTQNFFGVQKYIWNNMHNKIMNVHYVNSTNSDFTMTVCFKSLKNFPVSL